MIRGSPWPSTIILFALSANLLLLLVLLIVVLNIPIALPSKIDKKKEIVSHGLHFDQQYFFATLQQRQALKQTLTTMILRRVLFQDYTTST